MKHYISLFIVIISFSLFAQYESSHEHYKKAEVYKQLGNFAKAQEQYKKALEADPYHLEAAFNLASVYFYEANFEQAAYYFTKATTIEPSCYQAHFNLGVALNNINRSDEAIVHLRNAVEIEPSYMRPHLLLSNLLIERHQFDEAHYYLRKLLNHNHQHADAFLAVAHLEEKRGNKHAAIDAYKKSIAYNPQSVTAYFELGNLLQRQGDSAPAVEIYLQALNAAPNTKEVQHNLAHAYRCLGNYDAAIPVLESLLAQDPHNAHAHYGYAESLLIKGRLKEGFKEFEWRLRRGADERNMLTKQWDGSPLTGKTILLRAEYGQGDTLQFIRYARQLKQQGAYVIVEAQDTLVQLLSLCPYLDGVIAVGDPLPAFDVQLPIMSLPHVFKTDIDTIPHDMPYLYAQDNLVDYWHKKLSGDTNLKIGICWVGSPYYDSMRPQAAKKAMHLQDFAPLAQIQGISLYSLQKMDGVEQLNAIPEGMVIHHFGDDFDYKHGRFMDTAALIKNLDLVITVDTSVAHLAGALGKPVWMLLPQLADWRWMEHAETSPWYPTMRIFRKQEITSWELTMNYMAQELKTIITKTKNQSIVTAEISVGELIDKITILKIKEKSIKSEAKLANIKTELQCLNKTKEEQVIYTSQLEVLCTQLLNVNQKLWDIEDDIRDKERKKEFDQTFIKLARAVYFTNDERCTIKRQINDLVGSHIVEEKSYKPY